MTVQQNEVSNTRLLNQYILTEWYADVKYALGLNLL